MNPRPCGSHFLTLALLLLLAVTSVGGLAETVPATDWPAPRYDSANTGANIDGVAPTTDVGPRWTARVGTAGREEVGPTVANGTVYVGNSEGVLFAFDTEGGLTWRSEVGGSVHSSATLDSEWAYVIAGDTNTDAVELVAVDRTDGDVAWRYELGADRPYSALRGQPVVGNGTVFVQGTAFGPDVDPRRFVVAVDGGSERWRFDVGGDGATSPAVANGTVYIGTFDAEAETGSVVALDASDGGVEWRTDIGAQPAREPVVVDGEVYVATWSDVTVLDAGDGTVRRHLDVAAGGEAIAVTDDTVYAARWDDNALVALDGTTGAVRWTAPELFVETPPSVAGNAVVVGSNGGVVGLDPATGERLWGYTVDERDVIDSPPAVVDGAVYVGPANRRLYALAEGGSAVPGGLTGQLGRAIVSNTLLGAAVAIGSASLVAGTVAGTVVLGLARLLGFSWAPPRLLAARLLRRPYEDVGRLGAAGIHFSLSVLVLFVAGAVFLGGSILVSVFGPAGLPLLGGGPVLVVALLFLGGLAAWALLAYRWLPAARDVSDYPLGTLRRQAAVVFVAYAIAAGVLYPILLFVAMMIVFFR